MTSADALVDIAERSLAAAPLVRRNLYRINVFVDPTANLPATWGDGFAIPESIHRLLTCEGTITPTFVAQGRPLSVGPTINHSIPQLAWAAWNLVALCRSCHRQQHLAQLGIEGNAEQPDGITFTDATGRTLDPAARPRPPTGPPLEPRQPYAHPTGERLDTHWLTFPLPPSRQPTEAA